MFPAESGQKQKLCTQSATGTAACMCATHRKVLIEVSPMAVLPTCFKLCLKLFVLPVRSPSDQSRMLSRTSGGSQPPKITKPPDVANFQIYVQIFTVCLRILGALCTAFHCSAAKRASPFVVGEPCAYTFLMEVVAAWQSSYGISLQERHQTNRAWFAHEFLVRDRV